MKLLFTDLGFYTLNELKRLIRLYPDIEIRKCRTRRENSLGYMFLGNGTTLSRFFELWFFCGI